MTEKEVEKVIKNIKDLKVQGNTNIAKTVVKTIINYVNSAHVSDITEFALKLKKLAEELANARPNEPMAVNAVAFVLKDIEKLFNKEEFKQVVLDRTKSFFKYIDESYEIIRVNAVNLLRGNKVYFTHSHSSLVRDVLIRLNQGSDEILVINDETRPSYEGRVMAKKLSESGVKILHTFDSAIGSIFLDQRYPKPDLVIVGCDGITMNGDLISRVGTLNIALAAKEAEVPFYVVSQSMKLDFRTKNGEVAIEQRDIEEVWSEKERPKGIDILNPSFDLVPAEYITGGFITEKGLMTSEDIQKLA